MKLGEMTLEEAAKAAVGNWKQFECFVWHRERDLNDAADFTIVYTHHRDSGLLDESNAASIARAMEPFIEGEDPDAVAESHFHWAVGHVDGYSIRVLRRGRITEAFRKYHEVAERMADYPLLNESDYSAREYDATISNLGDAAWKLKHEYELSEGWQGEVYDWLSEHDPAAVENMDDHGGWPSESQLRSAFSALGYPALTSSEA